MIVCVCVLVHTHAGGGGVWGRGCGGGAGLFWWGWMECALTLPPNGWRGPNISCSNPNPPSGLVWSWSGILASLPTCSSGPWTGQRPATGQSSPAC